MKQIGSFISAQYGKVNVLRATYGKAGGPLAILLECEDGEPLTTLSVNMYKPDCSHDSIDLPSNCFYVKQWSENESIAAEAFNGGLFELRSYLPVARSGFVTAPVWQLKV